MQDFIGFLAPDGIQLPPCGIFYCVGHSDETSADMHCTALEYFGRYGVSVTQIGHGEPKVSLIDTPTPQADFTIAEATEFILQFCQALAIAQRAAAPVSADLLAAHVRELFPSACQ
jgi:hypothetical protein